MRASFEKKKSKFITKRQDIISSGLSQSRSSLRDTTENENKNSHKNNGGLKKALQQLQVLLVNEKEVREDLQKKINNIQVRTIQRENQFRRIIEQTIPFCLKQTSANVLNANLKSVHQKIMKFFETTQQNVEQHLTEQKKLLEQQMQRKIQALTIHVQKELRQNRRLQSLNYQTIHQEITKAMNLSTSILNENQSMQRIIKQLQFSNQIHQEEKQLLIAQILQKKNLIQKLYKQLRISYDQEDKMNEQMSFIREEKKKLQAKQQKNTRIEIQGCFKTIQNTKAKPIRLFHTQNKAKQDRSKDAKRTIKTQSSISNNFNGQRIYSTIDVKAHNSFKTSLNKPFLQPQQSGSLVIYQLRQSLKRERLKTGKQYKRIEYLIGYKRSIDLFLKECYNKGNLNDLNRQKIEGILCDLRDKIENDCDLKEYPKGSLESSSKDFIQEFQ